ncbi:MAG TPA: hypothetical protein VHS78_09250 [Candidatus Elarobacter sp.]|jgi:hypothetical protein|nr:hypothetical protein [Candidatus Elarobacter sp.]
MPTTIVLQQAGPLPISTTFSLPFSATPAVLVVYGSVWTQRANAMIGCQVSIDGSVMGTASVFSNTPSTHRQFTPYAVQLQDDTASATSPPESVTLQLTAASPYTVSDSNDSYLVLLHH